MFSDPLKVSEEVNGNLLITGHCSNYHVGIATSILFRECLARVKDGVMRSGERGCWKNLNLYILD